MRTPSYTDGIVKLLVGAGRLLVLVLLLLLIMGETRRNREIWFGFTYDVVIMLRFVGHTSSSL